MSSIINRVFPAEVFKNPFVQCPYFDLGCCVVVIGGGGGREVKPEKEKR